MSTQLSPKQVPPANRPPPRVYFMGGSGGSNYRHDVLTALYPTLSETLVYRGPAITGCTARCAPSRTGAGCNTRQLGWARVMQANGYAIAGCDFAIAYVEVPFCQSLAADLKFAFGQDKRFPLISADLLGDFRAS